MCVCLFTLQVCGLTEILLKEKEKRKVENYQGLRFFCKTDDLYQS